MRSAGMQIKEVKHVKKHSSPHAFRRISAPGGLFCFQAKYERRASFGRLFLVCSLFSCLFDHFSQAGNMVAAGMLPLEFEGSALVPCKSGVRNRCPQLCGLLFRDKLDLAIQGPGDLGNEINARAVCACFYPGHMLLANTRYCSYVGLREAIGFSYLCNTAANLLPSRKFRTGHVEYF